MQKYLNNQLVVMISFLGSIALLVSFIYLAFITKDPLTKEFSKAVAFVSLLTSVHFSTIIKITRDERIIETANN